MSLPSDYIQSLIHLYQPLIGMQAVNLYQTLLCEAEMNQLFDEREQTHHMLMNHLNMSLPKIYEARIKLEGIGLLNTYKAELDTMTLYTYELIPPFSPQQFFNDIMLTELLYRQIGESKFDELERFYSAKKEAFTGENVTASFDDVFQTYEPRENRNYVPLETEKLEQGIKIDEVEASWLEQLLKRKSIPTTKILTDENVRILSQLKRLYDLETYELENALLWALTDENELDINQLQAACFDLFTGKHNVSKIKLTYKGEQPAKQETAKPKTQRERLIERLETISPKELLEDLSAGNNASEQDMKMISDIMIKQGLPLPVMNVLVYYVLLQSNMKLSKQYMEKIASHWSRAKLSTAREAMEFALKESKPVERKTNRKPYAKTNNEVIPDWFKKRKNKEQAEKKVALSKEEIEKQRELETILQKYMNKN